METLLRLQDIDLKIEACEARELEIPKQKGKFDVQKKRLAAELDERQRHRRQLELEQRESEGEIELRQAQAMKYESQLIAIKDNDQYQALVHEIEFLKKQVGLKEERIIAIMVELDDAKVRLHEDRQRIDAELKEIDRQCAVIDAELQEAIAERKELEEARGPLVKKVPAELLSRYRRIRASKKTGPAVVPLRESVCSGCNMAIPAQMVNEVMGGAKVHACNHCGRLLYYGENHSLGEELVGLE